MDRLPFRQLGVAVLALSAASTAAVALALAVGAARPAPDLTPVLGEPPCDAPCWRTIQPGQTTLVDAVSLLDNDPTVDAVVINVRSASWWWNGAQSPVLSHKSRPFDGRILFHTDSSDSPIAGMALMTTLTLGDLVLALGTPHTQTFYLPTTPAQSYVIYEAIYDDLSIFATLACPVSPVEFWNTPAGITFGEVDLALGGVRMTFPGVDGWPKRGIAEACAP
jgi:hypothetical protein